MVDPTGQGPVRGHLHSPFGNNWGAARLPYSRNRNIAEALRCCLSELPARTAPPLVRMPAADLLPGACVQCPDGGILDGRRWWRCELHQQSAKSPEHRRHSDLQRLGDLRRQDRCCSYSLSVHIQRIPEARDLRKTGDRGQQPARYHRGACGAA